jgi:hypothetical protein
MSANIIDEAPSALKVKNTFLHFERGLQDDLHDEDGARMGRWKRQESEPARVPSMQRRELGTLAAYVESGVMRLGRESFAPESIEAIDEDSDFKMLTHGSSSDEPEAEPSDKSQTTQTTQNGLPSRQVSNLSDMSMPLPGLGGSFSRQVSAFSAFSEHTPIGSFCRQETEQEWPTWRRPITIDGEHDGPLGMPGIPWPPNMLSPYLANPFVGAPPGIGNAIGTTDSNAEKEVPTLAEAKTKPRRGTRKKSSLITQAHLTQLRQQASGSQQPRGTNYSKQQVEQPMELNLAQTVSDATQSKGVAYEKTSQCHQAKFCPICGGGLRSHFKFCLYCGAPVEAMFRGSKN